MSEDVEQKAEQILDDIVQKKGGQRRDAQVRLARGLARFQESGKPLLAEAPTGSGKSFAAIAAARATGEKCLIATHTHALQQQLQHDAETLAEETGEFDVSVLKGRSSYLCKLRESQYRHRLKEAGEYDDLSGTAKDVLDWADETETGDKGELDVDVPKEMWDDLSVNSEQCARKNCPFFKECFAEYAKTRAKKSDITILNHAIVAQGMKSEEFLDGEFPNIILDECHEFPSVVGEAFGAHITKPKMLSVFSKARKLDAGLYQDIKKDLDTIQEAGRGVNEPLRNLNGHRLMEVVNRVYGACADYIQILGNKVSGKDYLLQSSLHSLMQELHQFLRGDTDFETAWIEWKDDTFTLRSVLYNTGHVVKMNLLDKYHSAMFMSATIRVGKSFQSSAVRLGLGKQDFTGATLPHLFDYENNGLVWLPNKLKQPNDPEFPSQVAKVSKATIEAAEGRTMVLCSSWKNVRTVSETLNRELGDKYTILTQEPGVNAKLLSQRFREDPHAVLVGTRTFWTGVSFEGDTCLCVVIDKMPFPSPSEPVIAARMEHAERNEASGFGTVALPEAILTIVQGAGRLIRTPEDKGVLVICDSRLNQNSSNYKQYGERVLKSLPPMPITSDTKLALDKIKSFVNN